MAGRILIVDAVATNRIVLKVKLATAYFRVAQAATAAAALRLARADPPDLVLIDRLLPDRDALAACEAIRALPGLADLPVIVLGGAADAADRLRALAAGAAELLAKPVPEELLLAWIRNLLRARALRRDLSALAEQDDAAAHGFAEGATPVFETPGRIALLSVGQGAGAGWGQLSAALAPHRTQRLDARTALIRTPARDAPDVVVVDPGAADQATVTRLISDLQTRFAGCHAAVVLQAARATHTDTAARALDMGLADLLPAAAGTAERAARIRRQLTRKRQDDRRRGALRDGVRLSLIDPLTGLFNRRFATRRTQEIAAAAQLSGKPFAALVIDIDRFKSINDRYGHGAGDAALQTVARRLRAGLRQSDMLARIGGEEFLAILPDTGLAQARSMAERLLAAVAGQPVHLSETDAGIQVTMSIGLALGGLPDPPARAGAMAIERADRALLAAKAHGRNRINVDRRAA